jgi:NAD(P)-dependent dehydrogenase (short-subunit alcohol dehydrogenase family)
MNFKETFAMQLQNKTAVITGGNSGIGLAIAQEYDRQGANVVIFGRNQETLDAAAESLSDNSLIVQGDVTKFSDLDRLFELTNEQFGNIDVLLVNAGGGQPTPLDQVDEASFDRISDVNFKGAFFTVQKAVPYLNQGASVVLTTSVSNEMGLAGLSIYSATKAAVRSLARTLSAELLPKGIRVNALSPGPIQTPFFDRMGLPQAAVEGFAEEILAQLPIGRFGQPEEMAKAALFLGSSDSSYMVGAELVADGGISQL